MTRLLRPGLALSFALLCLLSIGSAMATSSASRTSDSITPAEHRRGEEQTFLTYPEWFLVHSPAEYAGYVAEHTPTDFPFWGHIGQLWRSYAAVTEATRPYPLNVGYHVMICVIATSTTVEYALRSAYETVIGRLAEFTASHRLTEEDRYGARVAQDYVDFIRVQPWYEYDFLGKLRGLWRDTTLVGPDLLRKWERKYALTTEYGVKAAYGWLIKKATKASYDEASPVTAVIVDRLPPNIQAEAPDLKALLEKPGGPALVTVPRYAAFKRHAVALARGGAGFREIAGNGADARILLTLLTPADWSPSIAGSKVLFEDPILTRPGRKRVALVVTVATLAPALTTLATAPRVEIEHVYDY
jgi:hypothetical protein